MTWPISFDGGITRLEAGKSSNEGDVTLPCHGTLAAEGDTTQAQVTVDVWNPFLGPNMAQGRQPAGVSPDLLGQELLHDGGDASGQRPIPALILKADSSRVFVFGDGFSFELTDEIKPAARDVFGPDAPAGDDLVGTVRRCGRYLK